MKIRFYTILLTLFALSSLITPLPAPAAIKCWTNDEGIKECGTAVPPEFAQQGHQELSKQGMLKEEVKRVKTEAELAEEVRQAEMKKQDQILLDTFILVEDIELARDDKIATIDSNITLTMKRNEKLQQDLDKRTAKATAAEESGEQPSAADLDDIESLQRQIETNTAHIDSKRLEKEQLRQEYAKKMNRFKELKKLN